MYLVVVTTSYKYTYQCVMSDRFMGAMLYRSWGPYCLN